MLHMQISTKPWGRPGTDMIFSFKLDRNCSTGIRGGGGYWADEGEMRESRLNEEGGKGGFTWRMDEDVANAAQDIAGEGHAMLQAHTTSAAKTCVKCSGYGMPCKRERQGS